MEYREYRIEQYTPVGALLSDRPTIEKGMYPTCMVIARQGNFILSTGQDLTSPPEGEVSPGASIEDTAYKLLRTYGIDVGVDVQSLGMFVTSNKKPPTYVIGAFVASGLTRANARGVWIDGDKINRLPLTIQKRLLALVLAMEPGDEFGYGLRGEVVIWDSVIAHRSVVDPSTTVAV
jgi:hypothetical protein